MYNMKGPTTPLLARLITAILLGVTLVACVTRSYAQFTLVDGNSKATIQVNSSAGMSSWTVDNVNQLSQQWFWYRIGAASPESSVNTISPAVATQTSAQQLTSRYANNQLSVTVDYLLQG